MVERPACEVEVMLVVSTVGYWNGTSQ